MKTHTISSSRIFFFLFVAACFFGIDPAFAQMDAPAVTTQSEPSAVAAPPSTDTSVARVMTPGVAQPPQKQSWLARVIDLWGKPPAGPVTEQDHAAQLARDGHYEEALAILRRLHDQNPADQSVSRDYAAILGWNGDDAKAVEIYNTLPASEPDYVLASIGHSMRQLGQTDNALKVYREGMLKYPTSVIFAEGEIRCLVDQGKLEEAMAKADDNLRTQGGRPEIVAVKTDIIQLIVNRDDQKAVMLARQKHYPESLAILSNLYTNHSTDLTVTRDYLAVLDWSGNHDDQVIALYKTLPAGDEPDYVLEAVGHAYRKLSQPDQSLPIYQEGLQKYPDNVIFAEGQIRSLADLKRYDEALADADQDIHIHGERPEIVDARKNVLRLMKPVTKKHHKKSNVSR